MLSIIGGRRLLIQRDGASVMQKFLFAIPLAFSVCSLTTAAKADDWVAQKLRGKVLVLINGGWAPLKRGDSVANSAPVRTLKDGQVEFSRDHETITLGPDTQIQIFDRVGQRFTTVNEAFGAVRIEANIANVKHFSVKTPFLAATVKGTIFSVMSGKRRAEVQVQRGKVRVEDSHHGLHVDVLSGQSATAGRKTALRIDGTGKLNPILNAADEPVIDPNAKTEEPNKDNKKKGDDNGNGNNGNGNNGDGKGKGKD